MDKHGNESIDLQFLEHVLDLIAENGDNEPIVSPHILDMISLESDEKISQMILEQYLSTYWTEIIHIPKNRPKICVLCTSITCEHLEDDEKMEFLANISCFHAKQKWYVEGTCIKCIIDKLQETPSQTSNSVLILWDSIDLGLYYYWKIYFDIQKGLFN